MTDAVDRAADAERGDSFGPNLIDIAGLAIDDRDKSDHSDVTDDDPPQPKLPPRVRAFVDWVVVIGIAVLIALVVKAFLLAHFIVEGQSMDSTLHEDDRVFVNKLSYRLHDPGRGDVIVLHESAGSQRDLIKRVIGLPGETVQIDDCQVYIDGFRLDEPYLSEEVRQSDAWCEFAPEQVPDGHVFVMGDNRPFSQDSRSFGPVSTGDLVGRAFVIFWPTDDMSWL